MNTWTNDELQRIADAEELEIAPVRRNGELRRATPIWVVRAGDELYVRAAYGANQGWHGVARRSHRARIAAGGIERDVTVEDADRGSSTPSTPPTATSMAAATRRSSTRSPTPSTAPPPCGFCPSTPPDTRTPQPERSDMSKNDDVLVITGAGGIGQAIARRQGPGKHILFADISDDNQAAAAAALEDLGHRVSTQRVDVSSRESVHALAENAAELGNVTQVVHTAGVSPVQAPAATDPRRRPARHRAGARGVRPRDRPGRRRDRHLLDGRPHVPAVRSRAGARAGRTRRPTSCSPCRS